MLVHYIDPHFREAIHNIAPRGQAFQNDFLESIDSLAMDTQCIWVTYLTPNKTRINMSSYCSSKTSLADLDKLKNLRSFSYLGTAKSFIHKCSPLLESLTLVSQEGATHSINKLPNLKRLILKENRNGLVGINADTKARIEVLEVQRLNDFSELEGFENLQVLHITNASNLDLNTIPALPCCTHLKLHRYHNGLGCISQNLPSIKHIAVPGARIFDLSPLQYYAEIKRLDLSNNCIYDITPLAGISIEALNLSGNMIEDIAQLSHNTQLCYLDISNNPLITLSPIQNFSVLEVLNLKGTLVTDLNSIKNLNQLKELFCNFSSEMPFQNLLELLRNMPTLERINGVPKSDAIQGCFNNCRYEQSTM